MPRDYLDKRCKTCRGIFAPRGGNSQYCSNLCKHGTCSIYGCDSLGYSKGFCQKHYTRNYVHGDPERLPRRGKDFPSKTRWTKDEIAWIAGLLEGEGSFGVCGPHKYIGPNVRCTMTDEDVIQKLQKTVGFGLIYEKESKVLHWKDKWTWRVRKYELGQQIVALIYPHMGERRKEQMRQMLLVSWERHRVGGSNV